MTNIPNKVKEVLERITKKKSVSSAPNYNSNKTGRKASGKNTRIEYLYADREGYKVHSRPLIFKGTLTERQAYKMFYKIMDNGFYPKEAGLNPLIGELAKLTGNVDDKGYHDLTSFETTDEKPNQKDNIYKFFGRVMATRNKT